MSKTVKRLRGAVVAVIIW